MNIPFLKMNGAGNDFVVIDARQADIQLSRDQVRLLASRGNEVTRGCDQLVLLRPSQRTDVFMQLYNADGSDTEACGNATRCVASLIMGETGKEYVSVATIFTEMACGKSGGRIAVDMGEPKLSWQEIPLAHPCDPMALPIEGGMAVSMGNPHLVFAVADALAIDLQKDGPAFEHHPLFPKRTNVSFAQVLDPSHIKLRVWERGAGATLACGTAACATVVALHRKGLVGRTVSVSLPGGVLDIQWDQETNHVWMTGPVETEFEGVLNV